MKIAQIEHDMINDGWKKFISSYQQNSDPRFYVESFQTKIKDDMGTKYFINCDKSDFSSSGLDFFNRDHQFVYTFKLQFTDEKRQTINIETVAWKFYPTQINKQASTLDDVYVMAENMWESFGKHYYEKY